MKKRIAGWLFLFSGTVITVDARRYIVTRSIFQGCQGGKGKPDIANTRMEKWVISKFIHGGVIRDKVIGSESSHEKGTPLACETQALN
jgi:hypothetical protein